MFKISPFFHNINLITGSIEKQIIQVLKNVFCCGILILFSFFLCLWLSQENCKTSLLVILYIYIYLSLNQIIEGICDVHFDQSWVKTHYLLQFWCPCLPKGQCSLPAGGKMIIPALAVSNTLGFPWGIRPQQISEVWDDHQGRKRGLGEVGTD